MREGWKVAKGGGADGFVWAVLRLCADLCSVSALWRAGGDGCGGGDGREIFHAKTQRRKDAKEKEGEKSGRSEDVKSGSDQTTLVTSDLSGGKVAEDLFERGLCLPSGTAMTNSDLDRVIDIILKCRRT